MSRVFPSIVGPRTIAEELVAELRDLLVGTVDSVDVLHRDVAVPVPSVGGIYAALERLGQDLNGIAHATAGVGDGRSLACSLRSAADWLREYSLQCQLISDLMEDRQ